ncbi:MAG: type II toxin-antitoxin system RelE/ParE family toxin [Vulcanimicrobiaceae bacterium]
MIASFADKEAERLFRTRIASKRLAPYAEAALRKLDQVHAATRIDVLANPPGNQLKKIEGSDGVWQLRIDQQHRIRFRWIGSEAHDVEIGDFH